MADEKGSALDAQLGADVADDDLFFTVDVSDTSMAASGTDKNITRAELEIALASDGIDTSAVHTGDTATGSFVTGVFPDGLTVGDLPGNTILGNNTASIGDAVALSSADVLAFLGLGPISSPVPIVDGGTGQTTQQAALDALAGGVTNNRVLAGNGTHVTLRALTVSDLPTGTSSSTVPVGGVITAAGPQGDASHTQVLTWNAAGQLTAATNTAIGSLDAGATTTGAFAIARIPTGTTSSTVPLGGVIAAAGPQGDASHTQVLTWNAAGQVTAVTNTAIALAGSAITSGTVPIGQLPTGTTSSTVPLGGVITGAGPQGDASHTQVLTFNNAGQLTTVTNTAIAIDASAITGGTLTVTRGGTGVSNPTAHAVYVGNNGSAAMTSVGVGTNGQLLIGQTTADPAWTTVGTDATLSAAGALTIAASAVTLAKMANLAANSFIGNNTGSAATPLALTVAQAKTLLAIATTDVSGLGNTATLNSGTGASQIVLGGVITAGGPTGGAATVPVITYNAAGQLTTVTTASVAINASAVTAGTLDVARGGTGVSSPTAHAVYVGGGSSAMASAGVGTAGQLLIGQGASSDPAWTSVGTDATLSSAGAVTIAASAVTLAKMANLADQRILGNNTGGAAAPVALTGANVMAMLSAQAGAAFDFGGQNVSNIATLANTSSVTLATASFGTKSADFDIVDVANGTAITLNASALNYRAVKIAPTVTMQTAPGLTGLVNSLQLAGTFQGNTGATDTFASCLFTSLNVTETIKTQDTNSRSLLLYTVINSGPLLTVAGSGALTISTINQFSAPSVNVPTGATVTALNGIALTGPTVSTSGTVTTYTGALVANPGGTSGTFTTMIGVDIAQLTRATTNIGFRCAGSVVYTPTVATVTSNAATVPVTVSHAKCTNSSAATCTITLATTNAVDGQELLVRYFDSSAASQTVTFTNSETGKAGAPPASLGSTTIPSTYRFIFNSGTSKWTYTGN